MGYSTKIINFFCWLARDNKNLTITNIVKKRCNIRCATDTCVLCHRNSKHMDHLLLNCNFSNRIWHFIKQNLGFYSQPRSISNVWTSWIPSLHKQHRFLWNLLSRVIFCNLWFERNNHILNLHALTIHSVIAKIIHMLLVWISTAKDPS